MQLAELFELETNRIISGVSVGYNSFFYVDADGIFYAHDSNSGDLKWKKELEDVVLSKILITSTQVFFKLLQMFFMVWIYKLEKPNGKSKPKLPLSIRGTASPIIYEGLIFTSFSNGRLAAVEQLMVFNYGKSQFQD